MSRDNSTSVKSGRITAIVAILFMSGITQDIQWGMITPLINDITVESGLTASEVGWVLNGMMLGGAVSVGLISRLGDTYGHRKMLLVFISLAMIGSLMAATFVGFWPLLIGRLLMGAAVAIPLSWGLLRPRGKAKTIRAVSLVLSLIMAIFSPLSIMLGGFIVSVGLPWQTIFWVIFFNYVVLLTLAIIVPETPTAALSRQRVDWYGAIGLGVWVSALLVAISEGPTRGWSSPLTVGAFMVAAIVFVAWIFQQRRAEAPLMSFRNMDVRQATVGYVTLISTAILAQGMFLVMPMLLQTPAESGFGHGMSTFESTYFQVATIPGAVVSYFWVRWGLERLGPRNVLIISGVGAVGLFLGFAFVHNPSWVFYIWVFLYGLTVMSFITVGYTLIAQAARQDNMAVMVGMQSIVQFVTSVVVTAILLNILNPGDEAFISLETFRSVYLALAAVAAVFVIILAVVAPKRVTDLHAIDTETDERRVTVPGTAKV